MRFFILLVVIPGLVYINFVDSTIKDEGGILLENKRVYGAEVNENMILKNVPLVISKSIEFQALKAASQHELDLLRRLKDDERIAELLPKTVSRKSAAQNLKPLLLILGNMFRNQIVEDPVFADSLAIIRKLTPLQVNCMMEVAMELQKMNQQG